MLQERLNSMAILLTETEEVKYLNFEIADEIAGGGVNLFWFNFFFWK
jgi:hypothetical protein